MTWHCLFWNIVFSWFSKTGSICAKILTPSCTDVEMDALALQPGLGLLYPHLGLAAERDGRRQWWVEKEQLFLAFSSFPGLGYCSTLKASACRAELSPCVPQALVLCSSTGNPDLFLWQQSLCREPRLSFQRMTVCSCVWGYRVSGGGEVHVLQPGLTCALHILREVLLSETFCMV